MGTILGYGQYFPVLNQMRYIFAIGLAIIVVGIFKALLSSEKWYSLSKLISLSLCFSWFILLSNRFTNY